MTPATGDAHAAVLPVRDVAVTGLIAGLVDDAGLFPPEELAMPAALRRHAADVAAGHPMLTQRFVCPASRLGEALGLLAPDATLALSVVADRHPAELADLLAPSLADARVTVAAVEAAVPPADDARLAALLQAVPAASGVWVESGWGDDLPSALRRLASDGDGRVRAKLRCGGVRQELFPSSAALAAALVTCAELELAWKATAGLHRAVRYTDPATGLRHHGYLNLLLAAARAGTGSPVRDVQAALDLADQDEVVVAVRHLTSDEAAAARRGFRSYGSCSTAEPVEEAARLGL